MKPPTSNLDSTRTRIVKRGCVVSYSGLRYEVQRVRLGRWSGVGLDAYGRNHHGDHLSGPCSTVQVVA